MGNWFTNTIEAKNITELDIYTNGCIDFNKIIPEPINESECPDEYNLNKNPDTTIMPLVSKPWYNLYKWQTDNWGSSIAFSLENTDTKEDRINFSTKGSAPFRVIAKLSTMVSDKTVIFKSVDIDAGIAPDILKTIWKDGKMVQAFVSTFDYDTEEYNPFKEIEITNQYDI